MTELAVANHWLDHQSREPVMTETSLELAPDLTPDEWETIGHTLGRANRASAWWIGDWVNYGEAKWGEKYDEAQRITGLSPGHLRNCAMVARRFDLSARYDKLTWTHHFRAGALENAEEWLNRSEASNWSVRELQRAANPESALHRSSPEPLGGYFGKGDKWREATEPLARYLRGFQKRGYQFGHVNAKEAKKRVQTIDQLIEGLNEARSGLEERTHTYRLTA